jgi:hypothetical protein
MKVKQLIAKLQKMPQNLDVFYAHRDNLEYETAGDCFGVVLLIKAEFEHLAMSVEDRERFDNGVPAKCVVIRG